MSRGITLSERPTAALLSQTVPCSPIAEVVRNDGLFLCCPEISIKSDEKEAALEGGGKEGQSWMQGLCTVPGAILCLDPIPFWCS